MTNKTGRERHWQDVYEGKAADAVSWYQDTPAISLALIAAAGTGPADSVIDVGGGASRLVDHLLDAGYRDVTVLDIADAALEAAQARLGKTAGGVTWTAADITVWMPVRRYRVWHDRAVFHFLTEESDRAAYVRALDLALTPDGEAVIATFAPDGPEKCSGLPVERYDVEKLAGVLGQDFSVAEAGRERHVTPGGAMQSFVYFTIARA